MLGRLKCNQPMFATKHFTFLIRQSEEVPSERLAGLVNPTHHSPELLSSNSDEAMRAMYRELQLISARLKVI